MKKINFKIRFENPKFWALICGLIILFVIVIAFFMGYQIEDIKNKMIEIILAVVAIISVVITSIFSIIDLTTPKIEDSEYTKSKDDLSETVNLTVEQLQQLEKEAQETKNNIETTQKIVYTKDTLLK